MSDNELNATLLAYPADETRWAKYILCIAGILLLGLVLSGLQKHLSSGIATKAAYDAEGLLVPQSSTPADACEAVEQQALSECDRMMENIWYDGGAIYYQREQHLKDFPRCQALSRNVFQTCSNFGKQ